MIRKVMKLFKTIGNFLMDWVWQLPQNLIGLIYYLFIWEYITKKFFDEEGHYHILLKETNGGVTLGKYVFVYKRFNDLAKVIKHESGHVKQSRMLGPLYLLVIGLPSILWAATHRVIAPEKDYYWFYTESWANKLAGIS